MYEIEQHQDYYVVRDMDEPLYVSGYTRNHGYKFVTDYLYAKRYTKATARKHADILNERS